MTEQQLQPLQVSYHDRIQKQELVMAAAPTENARDALLGTIDRLVRNARFSLTKEYGDKLKATVRNQYHLYHSQQETSGKTRYQ